ncbi:hypothetical protein PACILC2_20960 [Paenibacillus cisolokensis]|uniref:Uncharacterized protein n=1 Tax=Paenibacillus cisolokensis TaxID=1658519 RepID=A0ABQ4N5Q5_9BACL|nr:hypothetical protein PACILC2_20960 [Paenibacillus cisolokensis]
MDPQQRQYGDQPVRRHPYFCTIAFYSEYGFGIWLSIFLSTYIIKFIVSVCSTPFLYAARSFPVRREDEPAA